MNDTTAKGTLDKLTGKLKEVLGGATDNHELEAEGKADQVKGSAETSAGHVQDAGHNLVEGAKKLVK